MCFIKSASPPRPLAPTSTRLLYSGISSLFALLSFPTLFPLEVAGVLYRPTPGISRASAAEAAAVIEDVRFGCEE